MPENERSEGLFPAGPATHAMHLTPAAVMAFGLMLLLMGLMVGVEGRGTTWIYIGLMLMALVILSWPWPLAIFIMLYRGI
jgi:hypothetical protein